MDSPGTWKNDLPRARGLLPLGNELIRTDPTGPIPAAIAIVGIYPAHTRTRVHALPSGKRVLLPVDVERHSFDGSRSGKDLEERYLGALGLGREEVFFIDLYPYFLANTAVDRKSGRSMWDNIALYQQETGVKLGVERRPVPNTMIARIGRLPGNTERLAHFFGLHRPRLVITLGNEAAAYARGFKSSRDGQKVLYAPPFRSTVFGEPVVVVHCAHPGLFSRATKSSRWVETHRNWCASEGRQLVRAAVRASSSA